MKSFFIWFQNISRLFFEKKEKKNFFSAIQYSSESSKNTIEIEKKYYASVSGRFVWNLSDNSFATAFECNSNTLKTKQSLKTEKKWIISLFFAAQSVMYRLEWI